MAVKNFLTLVDVARRLGAPVWKVRRLFETKILPEPPRLGQNRAFTEADLPRIKEALAGKERKK